MKLTLTLLLTVLLHTSALLGQNEPEGRSSSSGACSPSHVGSHDTYVINCNGIGAEEGKKIISLLNAALSQHDLATINNKLDQLIAVASGPDETQTCVGSNCVQGTNYGPMTLNHYGAPKLLMTDAQRAMISSEMMPYAGMIVGIICNNATEDSMAYAMQLAKGLTDAGLKAGQPISAMLMAGPGGVIPAGVMLTVGDDRANAADSLGLAMLRSGLTSKPIPAWHSNDRTTFQITITPNR